MNPLRWLYRQVFEDGDREPKPDELVVVAEPADDAVAGIWRDQLERHGIRSMLKERNTLNTMGMRFGQLWPHQYELYVLYRDLSAAREILGQESNGPRREPDA